MKELEEYFRKLRFDDKFHLGLGDVRLTIAMQNEIIEIANRNASQQNAHLTLGSRPVFCVCCGGAVSHPVCTDCLPSPAQVA